MSNTVDNAFETIYSSEVKQAYQRKGPQLRDFVRVRNVEDGDTLVFQKLAAGTANQKARNGDVSPMNLAHSTVSVTTADWYAPEYIDDLDAAKTSINLRREYAEASAMALGRKHDDIILDAMDAGSVTSLLNADLSPTLVLSVLETLRDANADDGDLFFLIDNDMYTDIMADNQFSSADYTKNAQYDNASRRFNWLGFDFLVFSGLPTSTTGATTYRCCFAGSKSAVGFGINSDIKTKVDWVAQKDSWLVNSSMSVGATIIENAGLVEVQIVQ